MPLLFDAPDTHASDTPLAVPFRDLVLALQTRPPLTAAINPSPPPPPSVPLDERCAGVARSLDAYNVARPLLAAVLQSGWGVAPSHIIWSAARNATRTELLWAVGRTPFGPYAQRAELSFALRDAAARAPLYALAAEVVRDVRGLRDHFGEFHKAIDEVLAAEEHLAFLRRLNVLAFKLERAQAYLSLQSFQLAQYYVLSTWHDLRAMRRLLDAAGAALQASTVCD